MVEDVWENTVQNLKIIIDNNTNTIYLAHKTNITDITNITSKKKYYKVINNIIKEEIDEADIGNLDLYLSKNTINKNLDEYYDIIKTPRGICNFGGSLCFFNSASQVILNNKYIMTDIVNSIFFKINIKDFDTDNIIIFTFDNIDINISINIYYLILSLFILLYKKNIEDNNSPLLTGEGDIINILKTIITNIQNFLGTGQQDANDIYTRVLMNCIRFETKSATNINMNKLNMKIFNYENVLHNEYTNNIKALYEKYIQDLNDNYEVIDEVIKQNSNIIKIDYPESKYLSKIEFMGYPRYLMSLSYTKNIEITENLISNPSDIRNAEIAQRINDENNDDIIILDEYKRKDVQFSTIIKDRKILYKDNDNIKKYINYVINIRNTFVLMPEKTKLITLEELIITYYKDTFDIRDNITIYYYYILFNLHFYTYIYNIHINTGMTMDNIIIEFNKDPTIFVAKYHEYYEVYKNYYDKYSIAKPDPANRTHDYLEPIFKAKYDFNIEVSKFYYNKYINSETNTDDWLIDDYKKNILQYINNTYNNHTYIDGRQNFQLNLSFPYLLVLSPKRGINIDGLLDMSGIINNGLIEYNDNYLYIQLKNLINLIPYESSGYSTLKDQLLEKYKNKIYVLYSLNIKGGREHSGHWFSIIYKNNKYYKTNDSIVSQVSNNTVLEYIEGTGISQGYFTDVIIFQLEDIGLVTIIVDDK